MKILVTGSKGFIAKNLLLAINYKEHTVETYDLGDSLPSLKGFDWVIHLGAISSTTELDISKILNQNLAFSIKLIDQCAEHGVNFQWSSSAAVYGNLNKKFFKETDVKNPTNYYGFSKSWLEDYIMSKNYPIIYQGFRYFNVYGAFEEHKNTQASPFYQFTKQAINEGEIRLFEGSEHFKRDFVSVEKIVNTHISMFNSKESGIWNIGTGTTLSFYEVAKIISDKYKVPIKYVPLPEHIKKHYQYYTCSDTNKLINSLLRINND
jgi:ADP-L-glycero-D-manno-heptose 6-epimerase